VIRPIGAFLCAYILHQNGLIGTEPGTHATANTLVVGKHHFCHKHPSEYQIEDGINRKRPEQKNTPQTFPEVITGEQNFLAIQNPGHQYFQPKPFVQLDDENWHYSPGN
jgi:hypothetical protein